MEKKPINKLNKKSVFSSSENIASQNASIAVGGGIYIGYALLLALGLLLIAGTVRKGGCSCSCRCATNRNTMLVIYLKF